jgi:hypothetical protein
MRGLLAFVTAFLFAMQTVALADQPVHERLHNEFDVLAGGASALCGFDIRVHFVGDAIFTLFRDQDGNITKEIDVFPNAKLTVYRPETTIGYTTATPAVITYYYTDGAPIGSTFTAIVTGLVQKIPGIDLDSGRALVTGVVIGYDTAGVPMDRGTSVEQLAGPDLDAPQSVQRCAYFQ